MNQPSRRIATTCLALAALLAPLSALAGLPNLNYRGEMRGAFIQPVTMTNTLGFWRVTMIATNTDANSQHLFENANFGHKWARGDRVTNDTVTSAFYLGQDGTNSVTQGRYYTFVVADTELGQDTTMMVMETTNAPVQLTSQSNNAVAAGTGNVTAWVNLSAARSSNERVWLRWTTNSFATSSITEATGSGVNLSTTVPGQPTNVTVVYYWLSSTAPSNVVSSNPDLSTINYLNNSGSNYSYSVLGFGNSWHYPTNGEPSGAFMRNPPTNGVAPSQAVFIYNGTYTNDSNQTGGSLFYRKVGDVSFAERALAFDSNNGGGNQYWVAAVTGDTFAATNVVEYFLKITYANRATTFIGTTNFANPSVNVKYATTNEAATNTFRYTYGIGSIPTNLGNAFHIPANYEPTSNPPFQVTMRNPVEPSTNTSVFIYNGNQFAGGGNAANQTGGTLYYRKVGAGAFSSAAMSFDSEQGNNKYWVGVIASNLYAAGDEIEYYLGITYSDRDTTYIGTTNSGATSKTYGLASIAQTNTFRFTYTANLGNCWHIPANAEPPGATMRNPLDDAATNQAVFVYNGNQFQGTGTPGDQSGGTVYYRKVGDVTWLTTALVFNAESGDVGNNKYWRGRIPPVFGITNQVEYVIEVTYSDRQTTYLGTTNQTVSTRYSALATAQANPFRYTYSDVAGASAAFMWHADNRVVVGTSNVQFWVKIGYAEGTGSNRFVDYAAIYYTTNGATPGGSHGVATNASTAVAMMQFSNMQEDPYEGGDAMWWVGTVTNLPEFTTIKYKIGSYKASNTVERFADYGTGGTNNNTFTFSLGSVTGEAQTLTVNNLNANYTTTKFFVDEIAGDSHQVTVRYTPGPAPAALAKVEVFSNLDRRDYSDVDYTNANIAADGVPDGIRSPDANYLTTNDVGSYYRAYPMTHIGGGVYEWTGSASKCGAYRLTARYQLTTDAATNWTYYTDSAAGRRDHAVVVSPKKALEMTLYEMNTLTTEATAPTYAGRSTFVDLLGAADGDSDGFDPFNLDYLNLIQANTIWFQPIHPNGVERSENDPDTGSPYAPGSPYATRDYWAVTPNMGSDGTAATAMQEFTNFVSKCDAYTGSVGTINIMLDGVFNHTSWDAEMGQGAVDLGIRQEIGNVTSPVVGASDRIGSRRWYWYADGGSYGVFAGPGEGYADYCNEADAWYSAYFNDFPVSPDRGDFGKWADAVELYFGRYAALVCRNPQDNGAYLNEGDWFEEASKTPGVIELWRYFAYYPEYWLKKTGHSGTNSFVEALDRKGIDSLRCDFGQGLPPQIWEYVINRTRSKKWNFVFMAETLDGGKPGYRSNRHFDILNESLVFQYTQAKISDSRQFVSALEDRRNAYNGGAILLNITSHDEILPDDNPWINASRYGSVSIVDGLPMIFYGQEQGIKNYNTFNPTYDGFTSHELNFGKYVPHFKRWNQLTVWTSPPPDSTGMAQWYGRVNWARLNSPALMSRNRYFLDTTGGGQDSRIVAAAKYQTAGASPATSDVVIAFARFLEHGQPHSLAANTYNLQPVWNLLGLNTGKTYTVRNLASSDAFAVFTNGWPKTGADLYNNGIYVSLGAGTTSGSITNDGELVQYLKLVEVTNVVNQAPTITLPGPHTLAVGSTTNFNVTANDPDGGGVTLNMTVAPTGATFVAPSFAWTPSSGYAGTTSAVTFVANDNDGATNSIVTNSTTIVVPFDSDGDFISDGWEFDNFATLTNGASGDNDGDKQNNYNEYIAGTSPTTSTSLFFIASHVMQSGTNRLVTVPTQPGKQYRIYFSNGSVSNNATWSSFANMANGIGSWLETNVVPASYTFRDDFGPDTTTAPPPNGQRTYRVTVGNP